MTKPQDPSATLEKVRELQSKFEDGVNHELWKSFDEQIMHDFPIIASLCLEQAERIEELEEKWNDSMSWMQSVSVFCGMENKRRGNGEVVFDEEKMSKWLSHIDKNLPPEINSLAKQNAEQAKEIKRLRGALEEANNALFMHDQYQDIYRKNRRLIFPQPK